jgi:glycosyltransferase involved in cell wall biosynthesis
MKPQVSIIVPNFNHARFLHKRLDSIFEQTFQHWELILLDDHSSDHSAIVLKEYALKEKVSHLVINETNTGSPFMQWQKGFSLARGKYVWIAESDDYADPTLLETLVQAIEKEEGIGVAFCQSHFVDQHGEVFYSPEVGQEDEIYAGSRFISQHLSRGSAIGNAGMAIFRRDLLDKIRNHDYTKFRCCGDWYFWTLLAEQGRIYKSVKRLNYFRRHDNATSFNSYCAQNSLIEALEVLKLADHHIKGLHRIKAAYSWANFWIESWKGVAWKGHFKASGQFLRIFPLIFVFIIIRPIQRLMKTLSR